MNETPPETTPPEVATRRERLYDAMCLVEQRRRPPPGDPEQWREDLRGAVGQLDDVLADHVAATEASGGFFDELVGQTTGRLTPAVQRLRSDHQLTRELTRELLVRIELESPPEALQRLADDLLEVLRAHRHKGAELLWEAYGVELGVGD